MIAALAPERDMRGPGCDDRCHVVKALVPGVFGRSELMLHNAEAHEQYGRRMGDSVVTDRVIETGRLTVDLASLEVAIDGRPVTLTPGDLRLLLTLARHVGVAVEHDDLIRLVWGEEFVFGPAVNRRHMLTIAAYRLRRKLYPEDGLIVTIPGIGLRLEALPARAPSRRRPRRSVLNGRWAVAWEACRRCGRTDRAHNSHGYCSACQKCARAQGLDPWGGRG